ncbi:MAG: hypothetical protein MZU95_12110 [Desulfomicrobium escambiense]|nr:hypothetical protein [Desulfomicrobium escambiense]
MLVFLGFPALFVEQNDRPRPLTKGKPVAAQPVVADASEALQRLGAVGDVQAASDQQIQLFLVALLQGFT